MMTDEGQAPPVSSEAFAEEEEVGTPPEVLDDAMAWHDPMAAQAQMPWLIPTAIPMMPPQWHVEEGEHQQGYVFSAEGGCLQPMIWLPDNGMAYFGDQDQHAMVPMMQGARSSGPPRRGGESSGSVGGRGVSGAGLPPQQQKQRFCATYPEVGRCRHGARCAFAHSREEVRAPLLPVDEELRLQSATTDEFFMQRFKTLWCPIGTQHDWQLCMYAHTYQDVRRPPSIGYGHQLCPYWSKKETTLAYSQRCPLGPRCPYSHGAKEQLYHPGYFRTLTCRDLQRRRCPRRQFCAFHHKRNECRTPEPDCVDYNKPLKKEALPPDWLAYFLAPPHFQEVPADGQGEVGEVGQATVAPFWGYRAEPQTTALKDEAENDTPRTHTTAGESAEVEAEDSTSGSRQAAPGALQGGGHHLRDNRRGGQNGKKAKDGRFQKQQNTGNAMWGNASGRYDGMQWGEVPYSFGVCRGPFQAVPEFYSDVTGVMMPAYWDPSQAGGYDIAAPEEQSTN
mmetsp:Transcript_87314/g.245081  ORF Transcript_87314/g.245081 Transcript_87314/m.245081 type:complete len:505 (+) Transcript_87314:80-1594(+)